MAIWSSVLGRARGRTFRRNAAPTILRQPLFLFPVPCSLFPVPSSLFLLPKACRPDLAKNSPLDCFPGARSPSPLFLLPTAYSLLPNLLPKTKKREPFIRMTLNEIRRRPTLPGRFQPSTISVLRLNFCVRDGNRWILSAIVTGSLNGIFRFLLRQPAARSVDIRQYHLPSLALPSLHNP